MSFITQQPNGLYCRFSSIVDCPTHWNMTKEDYLNNVTGNISSKLEGETILERHLQPFSEVIDSFVPNNMTQRDFNNWVKLVSND